MPKSMLVAVLLLTACAPWTKEGASPDQLAADESACNQTALAEAPLAMSSMADAGPGANAPGYACVPNRGCLPTSGQFGGPAGLSDHNAAARSALFQQCMGERGWTH